MDQETLKLINESIDAWCNDHQDLLNKLERDSSAAQTVYKALDEMGLLNVLGTAESRDDLPALAEMAHQFGRWSSSLAVMVVQQNLASWIFAEAGAEMPGQWVALPLFDAVEEWRHQDLDVSSAGAITGTWRSLPLLPLAEQVLLPVLAKDDAGFRLLALPLRGKSGKAVSCSEPVFTLGLRGCPQADLQLQGAKVPAHGILLQGEDALQKMRALWSQAEICMMAIRAALAQQSYATARDYATQRYQGGKIIIRHSLIRKMLSDMYREISMIDTGWRTMAATLTPGQTLTDGQFAAALSSAEKLPWLASDGIQLLGGIGYMEEFPQERRFRDAKQCEFLLGHPQARSFALWKSEGL